MRSEGFAATVAFQRLAEFVIASITLYAWYFVHPRRGFLDPPHTAIAWLDLAPHVLFEVGLFFVAFLYLPLATGLQALARRLGVRFVAPLLPGALFVPIAALVIRSWPTGATSSMWLFLAIASAGVLAADVGIAAAIARRDRRRDRRRYRIIRSLHFS